MIKIANHLETKYNRELDEFKISKLSKCELQCTIKESDRYHTKQAHIINE